MADRAESGLRIYSEPELRHLLAWEVQRSTRYQDFLSFGLVRAGYPGRPDPRIRDEIARTAAELLRSTDAVGVMGEAIGMLLLHTPYAEGRAVTERVLTHIVESTIRLEPHGSGVRVALHLGFVSFPEDGTSDAALLAQAQARLAEPGSVVPPGLG